MLLRWLLFATTACGVAGCSDDGGHSKANDVPGLKAPPAPAAKSVCATSPENVMTIELPMFPERAESPTFGYSFKVHPGTDPSAPVVIYLPGGPGETSISAEREPEEWPTNFTLIQTDPRGVGCNAPVDASYYPDEFYGTAASAEDVLGIVRKLRLENYILYGLSYGTALATVTASKAEAQGLTPPKAVVLEGVLGQPFTTEEQVESGFQSEWRRIRDELPAEIRGQLGSSPPPLGLSADQWGAAISLMVSLGTVEPPQPLAEQLLLALSPEASDEDRAELRRLVTLFAQDPFDDFANRLHDLLVCHEIAETDFRSFTLSEGELVASATYCTSDALDRAYAARDWPVTRPIYYFNGSRDPNTPLWQARAHFDAEENAPRHFVTVLDAGHNPVRANLAECLPVLWSAIASDSGFEGAVDSCAWPTEQSTASGK
jgi:pimeloyl-ACP methyl ester carboxylesterase